MREEVRTGPLSLRELGKFLEIQNLALNLPFALGFLLVAAGGLPTLRTFGLVVVAFVAARNAGHSFNRWADRDLDAKNPRTQKRALVTGRATPRFALGLAALSATILAIAAYLLNPLALLLAPAALAIILAYSYTKRVSAWTTVFLGLVEAITPAAVFVAVRGALPEGAWAAVVALLLWGTAFETVHSLGDLEADRDLGLRSLPSTLGVRRSARLVPILHVAAVGLLVVFGWWFGLGFLYFVGLAGMLVLLLGIDRSFLRAPTMAERPFRRHFALAAVFLFACALGVLV